MKTSTRWVAFRSGFCLASLSLVGCILFDPLPPVKHAPKDAGGAAGSSSEENEAGEAGAESAAGQAGTPGTADGSGGAVAISGKETGGTSETAGAAGRPTEHASGGSGGDRGTATGASDPGGADGGNAASAGGVGSGGASGSAGAAASAPGGTGDSLGTAGESGDGGIGGAAIGGAAGSAATATGGANTGGANTGGANTGGAGTGGMATGGNGPCGPEGPSCAGGLSCDGGGTSCCKSLVVEGGSYERAPGETPSYPATVSSFCLDKYEVTVGRFRKFVAAYDQWRAAGHPGLSEGSHPVIGAPSGWKTEWTAELASDAAELKDTSHLNYDSPYRTWRDFSGTEAAERLPINYVNWYEAFAFCIWDGGRLPTEAEWQYAAQGGSLNREYPWGNEAPSTTRAVYDCLGDGSSGCSYADILPVGSKPDGNGYWQQSDLAGSMWEWNLDWHAVEYPAACDDCANLEGSGSRMYRGGSRIVGAEHLRPTFRMGGSPADHFNTVGLRCARTAN